MHVPRIHAKSGSTAAAAALLMLAQTLNCRPLPVPAAGGAQGERFQSFAALVASMSDSAGRSRAVDTLLMRLRQTGTVMTEDSAVTILYRGDARRAFVAGDLNGWDPGKDEMKRLPGTDLFYVSWRLDPAARIEYKLVVDSAWTLDPLNSLRASGGFGENSEVRMPRYRFPEETVPREGIPHGIIDTMAFTGAGGSVRNTVYVYLPSGYLSGAERYPALYVTDGGEYLSRAGMSAVLDNLIAEREISPLVAVFLNPGTDQADPGKNTRMSDYALN
ncbi:MAG TPA: alpha/beta hydrolase-fold protein, partial [Bacteroidota bacterium]|nr:alpha/beta hydrolase-fold protein [Bacteroidota bacterium]